jgi:hypothetical protein
LIGPGEKRAAPKSIQLLAVVGEPLITNHCSSTGSSV